MKEVTALPPYGWSVKAGIIPQAGLLPSGAPGYYLLHFEPVRDSLMASAARYYQRISGLVIENAQPVQAFEWQLPARNEEENKATIHRYLSGLFLSHRDILENVYLVDSPTNQLLYSIVLREDSFENRALVFSILEEADIDTIYPDYSVYFQFYPQHLKDKVQYIASLDLQ